MPTILVVDDDHQLASIYKLTLEGAGYKVVIALNGQRALAIIQETRPDLVLLDHMMPGISGGEVCQNLKADPLTADIPVVVYTAAAESGSDKFRKEIGADYLLRKPAPMPLVLQTIREALSALV